MCLAKRNEKRTRKPHENFKFNYLHVEFYAKYNYAKAYIDFHFH